MYSIKWPKIEKDNLRTDFIFCFIVIVIVTVIMISQIFAFWFSLKLQNKHCKITLTVSMTMTGKTRYMSALLVLKETESKNLENFTPCIHFYNFFISEKKQEPWKKCF